jgi:CubicO group peptidase (beta-lactamase class C family)
MDEFDLRAVIVRVTINGDEVATFARGESLAGVPATTDMHFRNGAVAISYVSTLLLMLVDEGRVDLNDTVSTWLPQIPHGEKVTLGQLAQMISGYPDYVIGNEAFGELLYDNPFRQWQPEELLALIADDPLFYEPGTNWNYAHTNYVILGLVLEEVLGQPMAEAMEERVLGPLGLTNTSDPGTPAIAEPVLHAFSSERRDHLGVSAGTPFYEETTFWNPSWTITRGAIQTTNIYDLNATASAISSGILLSPESHELMVSTDLRGFGSAVEGCPTCFQQSVGYSYGLGIITTGNWLAQNPMFAGEAAAFGYLPSKGVAIAVALTFSEAAFDEDGNPPSNRADELWREIGELIVPDDAPPIRR